MLDCEHVFCRDCLQDFYNNAIKEGDLATIRCLAPDCSKKRAEAQTGQGKRKPKVHINPSELLQIPLEQDVVQRYVMLKRKAELESDKDTIYCPRKWCQGAARSKKHRKSIGDEGAEDSSDEEDESFNTTKKGFLSGVDLLAICEDCSFAFCRRCYMGWHGESIACTPRRETGELTDEDKASLEYLKLYSTPCPTCAAPAQKTHGCNHMICFRCNSHFCYLCSAWLQPDNPYKHFNMDNLPCYMRLWELEGGDGDDVDRNAVMPDEDVAPDFVVPILGQGPVGNDRDFDDDDPNDDDDLRGVVLGFGFQPAVDDRAPANNNALNNPNRPAVEREAPLVLRLAAPPPPPPPAPAVEVYRPGRGGRGGGGGLNRGGRGGGRGRGNVHNVGYNARRDAAVARRVRDQAGGVGVRHHGDELNEADQAWVQQFVLAALRDEEDELH